MFIKKEISKYVSKPYNSILLIIGSSTVYNSFVFQCDSH